MTAETTSAFALQVIALITGGSIVQLVVFLLRRRTELSALDKSASAPLLASANELIVRLENAEGRLAARVGILEGELAASQSALLVSQAENRRLTSVVAQLRTDVDICQLQVDKLRAALNHQ